jgi:hypothetical protein
MTYFFRLKNFCGVKKIEIFECPLLKTSFSFTQMVHPSSLNTLGLPIFQKQKKKKEMIWLFHFLNKFLIYEYQTFSA